MQRPPLEAPHVQQEQLPLHIRQIARDKVLHVPPVAIKPQLEQSKREQIRTCARGCWQLKMPAALPTFLLDHALVTVCSGNTNVTVVWAWVLWSPYALGTASLLWFGHGCSGHRMLWEHERYHDLGMGALVTVCSGNTNVIMIWAWVLWSPYALGTRTLLWFGHGCSGHGMLWEHERYHDLGMGALVTVCSGNTNVIMIRAWVLWSPYALGTRTLS